jgi:hypothetical protein
MISRIKADETAELATPFEYEFAVQRPTEPETTDKQKNMPPARKVFAPIVLKSKITPICICEQVSNTTFLVNFRIRTSTCRCKGLANAYYSTPKQKSRLSNRRLFSN